MTARVSVFEGVSSHPTKGAARKGRTLRAETMKQLPKHRQFTTKRRKALVKRLLAWVSALISIVTLVKLVVELIVMLYDIQRHASELAKRRGRPRRY